MEYRILGILEARAGGRAITLGGLRQRRVLAALLLRAGRVTSIADLVEAAWGGDPPSTVERQVRNRVAALRSILTRHGGLIDTVESGYRLRLDGARLDLVAFDDLVARGRAASDPALLREALGLWRGPALHGLGGAVLGRAAAALEEDRLAVVEDCLTWESERSPVSPAELRELVEAHPSRERLVGLLMAALARSGRREEALAVYRSTATRLADDLGIDPSPELRRQYAALRHAALPAQLPADVSGFTGRVGEFARLDALLSDAQAGRVAVVSAISGTAGAGKTATAVHWAHTVRDKFPDGQLHVNLRGYSTASAADPHEVLGGFLRALGVKGQNVPVTLDEAVRLYRDRLADRRVLVLLDNAATADQVRPLIPESVGCLALITSRDTLTGLTGPVVRLTLDVLPTTDAYALLTELLGAARVAAEPEAAGELARLCAHLPLALRIAAANITDGERLADHVTRLAAGDRLTALAVDGDERAAVRAAFHLSYAALPDPARRMFRLLGVAPGPDVTVPAAASLAGVDVATAAGLLDRLAAAHLVAEHVPGRYTSHDLLRAYAVELAATDPDRDDALHRFVDHYLHTAHAGWLIMRSDQPPRAIPMPAALPGMTRTELADLDAAMAWFTAERTVLLAAISQAAAADLGAHCWLLADKMTPFLYRHGYWHDLYASQRGALHAARRLNDWRAEIFSHRVMAFGYRKAGRLDDAAVEIQTALALAEQHGDLDEAVQVWHAYADLCESRGDLDAAVAHADQAVALSEGGSTHTLTQADALNTCGWLHARRGDYRTGLSLCTRALRLCREMGGAPIEANTWDSIGYAHLHLGEYAQAAASYQRALDLHLEQRDQGGQAAVLTNLGDTARAAGDPTTARQYWQEARAIYQRLDQPTDHIQKRLDSLR